MFRYQYKELNILLFRIVVLLLLYYSIYITGNLVLVAKTLVADKISG